MPNMSREEFINDLKLCVDMLNDAAIKNLTEDNLAVKCIIDILREEGDVKTKEDEKLVKDVVYYAFSLFSKEIKDNMKLVESLINPVNPVD